jgi:hypothetical protein
MDGVDGVDVAMSFQKRLFCLFLEWITNQAHADACIIINDGGLMRCLL